MKKLLILALLTLCVSAIAFADKPIPKDPFDEFFQESIPIHHPLFEKVFPGVEFKIELMASLPPQERLVGWIGGERLFMPAQFNELYAFVAKVSKSNLDEKVEALVRLMYWLRDDSIEIVKQEEVAIEKDGFEFNRHIILNMKTRSGKQSQLELFIVIKDGEVKHTEYLKNGEWRTFPLRNGQTDDETLTIYGVTPELYDGNKHYYIVVGENGISTNNSITFKIAGLNSSQIIRLVITPIYGYIGDNFHDVNLTAGADGKIIHTWTPPNNNKTGIADLRLYDMFNRLIYYDEHIWIIPEKAMINTFPNGYDFTLKFTNQFFYDHPDGIAFASTYAQQVEQALIDSWNYEVLSWSLCQGLPNNQPIDGDENYQVFINDSQLDIVGHNYHGTIKTIAIPGEERKIGIGSLIFTGNQFGYPDETTLIYTALRHEFYHGIQFSHNYSAYPEGIPPLLNWMTEGQARFLQTVFTTHSAEYQSSSMYHWDANQYISRYLNSSLHFISLPPRFNGADGYPYCLFWRFLYETYTNGTVANKLQIIRETCHGYNDTALSTIESHLDDELEQGNGSYSTFDDAIKEFAKRIYFNDPTYNLWSPDPNSGFYATPEPEASIQFNGEPAIYTSPGDLALPASFGMDYLAYNFFGWQLTSATFTFNQDPDNHQQHADFGVNVMRPAGGNVESNYIPLTQTIGSVTIDAPMGWNLDQAVIAVTRLDNEEANLDKHSDYQVTIASGTRISAEPLYPPVIFAWDKEGSIIYNLSVTNNSSQRGVQPDIWCYIYNGQGVYQTTIYQAQDVPISPGQVWQEQLTYDVPSQYFPPGEYEIRAFIGIKIPNGGEIVHWDHDEFTFKVVQDAEPEIDWLHHYNGAGNDLGYDAYETSSGNIRATGSCGAIGLYVLETNSQGGIVSQYSDNRAAAGYSINSALNGGYVITGTTPDSPYPAAFIRVQDMWGNYYFDTYPEVQEGYDAIQLENGQNVITGYTNLLSDVKIVLMQTQYNWWPVYPIWTRQFNPSIGTDCGRSVKKTFDGGYIVSGVSNPIPDYNAYLLKTDVDGIEEWSHEFHTEPNYWEYGEDVHQLSDGGYVIAGWANADDSWSGDVYLIRTDIDGELLWQRTYRNDPVGWTIGKDVYPCAEGGFIIAGTEVGYLSNWFQNVYVLRVDGGGNQIWELSIDAGGGIIDGSDIGESIRQTDDGGYIICGTTKHDDTIGQDLLLVRLGPDVLSRSIASSACIVEPTTVPQDNRLATTVSPNPFNPSTVISYNLQNSANVNLSVYNIAGRLVEEVIN
ncbi:MAG: hypothetical protein NTW14_12455, partial [bacterium]|nr:hypothetical protein [bacterium]